jgi:hypothetical protein
MYKGSAAYLPIINLRSSATHCVVGSGVVGCIMTSVKQLLWRFSAGCLLVEDALAVAKRQLYHLLHVSSSLCTCHTCWAVHQHLGSWSAKQRQQQLWHARAPRSAGLPDLQWSSSSRAMSSTHGHSRTVFASHACRLSIRPKDILAALRMCN